MKAQCKGWCSNRMRAGQVEGAWSALVLLSGPGQALAGIVVAGSDAGRTDVRETIVAAW